MNTKLIMLVIVLVLVVAAFAVEPALAANWIDNPK